MFRDPVFGSIFWDSGLRFEIWGFGFRASVPTWKEGLAHTPFRDSYFGFRFSVVRFWLQDFGFRVSGCVRRVLDPHDKPNFSAWRLAMASRNLSADPILSMPGSIPGADPIPGTETGRKAETGGETLRGGVGARMGEREPDPGRSETFPSADEDLETDSGSEFEAAGDFRGPEFPDPEEDAAAATARGGGWWRADPGPGENVPTAAPAKAAGCGGWRGDFWSEEMIQREILPT